MYTLCSLPPFFLMMIIYFANLFVGDNSVEISIGKAFYPVFSFLFKTHRELRLEEIYHLVAYVFYLFLYLSVYLIGYIIMKTFYIGTNPNVHRTIKAVSRVLFTIGFLALTFGPLSLFIIQTREIMPLGDGFLATLFNVIHRIEA